MLCPFNRDVGDLPALMHCPQEVLVCPCAHHLMRYAFGIPNDTSMDVVEFWQQHPNPPSEEADDATERIQRYEEHVAYVVGVARKVTREYNQVQVTGPRKSVSTLELTLDELAHAIGVLDLDGIEPDDDGETPGDER